MHSDVCGPMPMLSMGGVAYFVTFIDDFSCKTWVYSLRRKDEVKVKCLHSDNGGEYVSKPF